MNILVETKKWVPEDKKNRLEKDAQYALKKQDDVQGINKDKQKTKKAEKEMLHLPGLALILIGLMGFAIILIVKMVFFDFLSSPFFVAFDEIFTNVSNVFIAVGLGSVILEFFGYIKYIKERLRDILIDDEYLEILNVEKKEELVNKLEEELYYPGVKYVDRTSLFHVVKDEIKPLLKEYYFEEYLIRVKCEIYNQKYFKKSIYKKIVYNHLKPEENIFISNPPLRIHLNSIEGQKVFQLTKFIFGTSEEDKDLTQKVLKYVNDDKPTQSGYDLMYTINLEEIKEEFKLKDGQAKIILEYTTISAIEDDKYYSHRVSRPCKNYCIHFDYDPNLLVVHGEGFGFMDTIKSRVEQRNHGDSQVIRFFNWILPGNGVNFTILPK